MQIAVGPDDQLEVAVSFAVGFNGKEPFVFHRAEKHGLFIQSQLADLVEKQQSLIGRFEQAGPGDRRAGERSLDVTEQRGHRLIATQRRAVDLDELAPQLFATTLQTYGASRRLDGTLR